MSKYFKFYKPLAAGVLAIGLLLATTGGVAEAHVLKEDNGISAVLHIPPEDNPEAGQSTELDLSFGDAKDAFSLPDCNCQVVIKSGGRVLQKLTPQPALAGATLDSIVNFQFPTVGIYDVIVSGSAKDGAFNTFSLDYLVRVATSVNGTGSMSSGQGSEVALVGAGSLAILVMIAYTTIQRGGRYKPSVAKQARKKVKGKQK